MGVRCFSTIEEQYEGPLLGGSISPAFATFLLLCFLAYYINDVVGAPVSIPLVLWAAALIWGLLFVPASYVLISFAFFFFLCVFYLIGYAFSLSAFTSLDYIPQLLTGFIACMCTVGILSGQTRMILSNGNHLLIQRSFLLISLPVIYFLNRYIIQFEVLDTREIFGFSYLTTSDFAAMAGIAYLSRRCINVIEFLFFSVVCFVIVAFLGSRSAMALFLISVTLLGVGKIHPVLLLTLASVSVFFGSVGFLNIEQMDIPALNRFKSLLEFSTRQDSSLSAREQIFQNSLDRLDSSTSCLLFGCHAPTGSYAHNFLSVVEYFGAFGFFGVLTLLCISLLALVSCRQWVYIPLFFFLLLSLTLTRAWVSPVFPIFIGLMIFLVVHRSKLGISGLRRRSVIRGQKRKLG